MGRSKKIDLDKLVAEFAEHKIVQTDSIFRADAKTANRHAKKVDDIFRKLRAHEGGRDALVVLFKHPRMDVRVAAAAYLLRHRTAEAKAVLREVAKGEGIAALRASEALKRWKEGTWQLDPEEHRRK